MFLIDEVRGIVRVNAALKRSTVATWEAVVKVEDTAGGPEQTATGRTRGTTHCRLLTMGTYSALSLII